MSVKTALIACALASLAVTPAAVAQTASPVGGGDTALSTSGAKATDDNIARFLNDQGSAAPAGAGDSLEGSDVVRDRAPHGEVGFTVGNHGYHEVFGVVTMPLGDRGSATVAVSQGQMNFRRGSLNHRSLAVNLALGDAAGPSPMREPLDVCDVHRAGAHVYEPYWLTRMRQDQLARQGRPCPD